MDTCRPCICYPHSHKRHIHHLRVLLLNSVKVVMLTVFVYRVFGQCSSRMCAVLSRPHMYCMFAFALTAEAASTKTIDEAIATNNIVEVRRHLSENSDNLNRGSHPKLSPLHQALLRKRISIAELLIQKGANLDLVDSSQRTPLHLSVERNLPTLVQLLLAADANPDLLDSVGWTPLHHAAAKDRIEIARLLIEGGANVAQLSRSGGTALHEAAASGSVGLVRLLIEHGVDSTVVAKDGTTALDIANLYKNHPAVEVLEPLSKK